MKKNTRYSYRLITAAVATALAMPAVVSALEVQGGSFTDDWIKPDARISVKLDGQPGAQDGVPRFFIGSTDVTALFRHTQAGEYSYSGDSVPLPGGRGELIVYLDQGGPEWREIGRLPIQVLTAGGFEEAEFTPRLDLGVDAQLDEGHHGDAEAPRRSKYQDLNMNAGLATRHVRGDLSIQSSVNIVSSSNRERALRYGEKGEDAPKLDLSDYLLEVIKGDTHASVGHVSYGNNPLLLNGFGSRGISVQHRINERADVSISSMNGTSIVGYDNLLGLRSRDHNVSAATVGYEVIADRPGALRVEVMYMDASIESQTDFDAGEIPDAETSSGVGLRVLGSNESGSLRGDVSFARSDYDNPEDPALSGGDDIVAVDETTNDARAVEVSYDLLRDYQISESQSASLTATLRHERVDPLYKSLGAFANSDQLNNQINISGQIGDVGLQLAHIRNEDNLDDLDDILKTKTRTTSVNLSLPLASMFGDAMQSVGSMWPSMNYAGQRVHQFGANLPFGFDPSSHIPDQISTQHNASLNWNGERWNLGYSYDWSEQDNRQPGRAKADFETASHGISIGINPTDSLAFNVGLGRTRAVSREDSLTRFNDTASFGFDYRFSDRLSLNGNYSTSFDEDSDNNASSDSFSSQTQLNYSFDLPMGGRKVPAQFFLRHSIQRNVSLDNIFNFNTDAQTWAITSGISISVFQ